MFEQNLSADYLRAHLKHLPDFDDEEAAENRALDMSADIPIFIGPSAS
jgi:hypothetical protein